MVSRRNEILWGICTNTDFDGEGNPCPNCANKVPLSIRGSHKFECPECKEPLTKIPAPKTWWEKYKWLVIAPLVVLIFGGGILAALTLSSSNNDADSFQTKQVTENNVEDVDPSLKEKKGKDGTTDSVAQSQDATGSTVAKEVVQEAVPPVKVEEQTVNKVESKPSKVESERTPVKVSEPRNSGSKNLGYATFKGTLKNGLPDDVNGRLVFSSSHVIDSKDPKGRVAEPGDYVIGEFSEGHLVQGIWYGSDNVVKGRIIIGK